jgi:probable HAF family extracellular repeat protein
MATPVASIVAATVSNLPFRAIAVNDAGQIAGSVGQARAVLYTPGSGVQDLGTLGGPISIAYGLNELGQVVGASTTALGERHAFLWTPGVGMQDLGTLDGGTSSTARGINDRGQVVGESVLPRVGPQEPQTHAFLWTAEEGMQDLGSLGEPLTSSVAYDINNAGQVVGRSFSADPPIFPPNDPEFRSHAFLWSAGTGMQELGALSGGYSVAYAVNEAGQVVGRSWLATFSPAPYGQQIRAVLWTPGQAVRDLGGLWAGPYNSAAYGINDVGQIVGESDLGIAFRGYPVQPFLWTTTDGMEALSPTTGLTMARDINNRQQVVGDGRVATVQLAPGNDVPVAVTGGPYIGTEGSLLPLDLSGRDNNDVGFLFTVAFGDDASWVDIRPPTDHLYPDNGTYTLSLTVRDQKGATDTRTTTVTIANAAPTILGGSLTGPTTPIRLTGGIASAPISFEFRDLGGTHDRYAAEVACGNGLVLSATDIPVSETYSGSQYIGGTGSYAGTCRYASPGVYTVRALVSDEDGGVSAPAFWRYVIVYDPAGGSATGTGFYAATGPGQRKTHFSFDATFTNDATPNGSIRIWAPGAELNFESTTIEMLVVAGDRAQFWGIGTLNGVPSRFRITAVDGRATGLNGTGDAIRVELWDPSGTTVLYDTQPGAAQDASVTTPIDGGNIRIRAR